MRSTPRVCYAGTYERDYPRNRIVIDALRDAGAQVEEAHAPVFERRRDKSSVGLATLGGLAVRLALAYLRLIPDVALRLLRCDALMLGYVGQLDALVLAPLARMLGRPVIFNPLVTLTDTVVEDRGQFAPDSVPARAIALLDRLALGIADLVLADTTENARYMSERFGVLPEKIVVVPVGADEGVFFPSERATDRPGCSTEAGRTTDDPLDVLFVGKFIPLHGIETVVRATALLERRGVPARFELVGTGQTYQAARTLANELGAQSIAWTDWIPFDRLGARLRAADVVLGVFDGGAKAARVIPNKVYQSTACGVATVTRRCPAIETYLHDGESALLVSPDDAEALAQAIERLCDTSLRREIAAGGRLAYEQRGSQEAVARALAPVVALARDRGRAWRDRG
ncbi:MAG TPA: glycosyltransferase [Thermomicrobiales bacterium]|mgnify:CR=1 FL=1|nr:glycosyltransferase [Thermomicrobiales bacterium]HRA30609.1 glycosyltransferase [Thermomicrobiales bacterium]